MTMADQRVMNRFALCAAVVLWLGARRAQLAFKRCANLDRWVTAVAKLLEDEHLRLDKTAFALVDTRVGGTLSGSRLC